MDRKVQMLAGLFSRASPLEARYLARIINGTIRLGVADMTIIAALAEAYAGGRENKEPVERAYNLFPDLGSIAKVLLDEGLDGVMSFQPQVGVPIRMMLASRLSYEEILPKLGGNASQNISSMGNDYRFIRMERPCSYSPANSLTFPLNTLTCVKIS